MTKPVLLFLAWRIVEESGEGRCVLSRMPDKETIGCSGRVWPSGPETICGPERALEEESFGRIVIIGTRFMRRMGIGFVELLGMIMTITTA